jgi:hypothetical protein
MEKCFHEDLSIDSIAFNVRVLQGRRRLAVHDYHCYQIPWKFSYEGIDKVREYQQAGRKGLLGLHLEGPYLNPLKKGAHIERYIKRPIKLKCRHY